MNSTSTKLIYYNRIIFFLSVVGFAIAIYVLQSFLRKTSIVCLTSGCDLVRKHPASYILGIPVPAFGLAGYFLLAIFSFLRSVKDNKDLIKIIFGISTFGFFFVLWFTYTEIFTIKAICTWCGVSALIMTTIFILSLNSFFLGKELNV